MGDSAACLGQRGRFRRRKLWIALLIFGWIGCTIYRNYDTSTYSAYVIQTKIEKLSYEFVELSSLSNENIEESIFISTPVNKQNAKLKLKNLFSSILAKIDNSQSNRVFEKVAVDKAIVSEDDFVFHKSRVNVTEDVKCDLPPLGKFVSCPGKIKWMEDHWRSDPCYKQLGVDGTRCSIIHYLSEVENFCPLLAGRSPRNFIKNGTNQSLPLMTKLQLDIEPLYTILTNEIATSNYDWIRNRIHSNWQRWTSAARDLVSKNQLKPRPQLKILLHLGLLSKSTNFKIVETSDKGGPLGELVQWSDIIASLYILGHNIEITSEQSHLAKLVSRSKDLSAMCQSPSDVNLDLIYTDIVGLKQFKRVIVTGFAKFACRLRIIDSFGTQPAFNAKKHAKRLKAVSVWGNHNLNPMQFFTMFPHTPDNSFMGFVVLRPDIETVKPLKKLKQALVYGKAFFMWQGKEAYLSTLSDNFTIHATVFGGTEAKPEAADLPSYVHNHGIMSTTDLQQLLSLSRVFVGLGFPFEGPAPLEAIAQGCVFLNPRFSSPQNAKNNKFFKGKPTFRELNSQHPYAEDFIGEPHVITLNIDDPLEVKRSIEKAIRYIETEEVQAFIPFEYTEQGMLQRIDYQINNQDFCRDDIVPWIPDSSVTILKGEPGKDCLYTCKKQDLICEPTHFAKLNTKYGIKSTLGLDCNGYTSEANIWPPSISQSGQCVFQADSLLFSCVGSEADYSRVCPCRDYIKGQSAVCKNCL